MSDNSLSFVQAAVDTHPNLPAGIPTSCEYAPEGGVIVTLSNEKRTTSFHVSDREANFVDSEALTAALNDRIIAARDELNPRTPPKKKRKAKKAKRKAKSVKLVDATPEQQKGVDEALAPLDPP